METGYAFFDHTADLGVRVRAPSLPELIAPATEALYATVGELVPGDDTKPVRFTLTGDDPALLLRDYLAELLTLVERDERRVVDVRVIEFSEARLDVDARSAPVDAARSDYRREVKAITYHELSIRPIAGGCEASFIVDI